MGNHKYRLFMVDLDGTLIGKDSLVSARVATAMSKISKRLKVSIATGREAADAKLFSGQLELKNPQISENGALVVDPVTGRQLKSWPMGPESTRHILSGLREMDLEYMATRPNGTLAEPKSTTGVVLARISALDLEEAKADLVMNYFRTRIDINSVKVFLPYNNKWAVDFTRSGVNKATATEWIASSLGLGFDAIVAAGDSYNDLPLLRSAALAIVMGDAPSELKAVADYIAPTVCEDGLAVAIEEFLIPRLDDLR